MITLARVHRELQKPSPQYRLLHESGRLSNDSMFVVGVFQGTEIIGEGTILKVVFGLIVYDRIRSVNYIWSTASRQFEMF